MAAVALVALIVVISLTAKSCGSDPAPDVRGMTLEEATQLASAAGLKLVKNEQELPYFVDPGTILDQSPLPDIKSEDGNLTVTVSREPVAVQINSMAVWDPDGDNLENDATIGRLTDNNPGTSWSTEAYKSPVFEGLGNKKGVGLRFSLDDGATMVRITYTLTGWRGEVQKITSDGSPVVVASLGDAEQVNWTDPLATGRIWFTLLAQLPDSEKYGVVISEISFWK